MKNESAESAEIKALKGRGDTKLIKESEVMKVLHVSSRTTMWKYCKIYNFPLPVRTRPKAYLRSAVDSWVESGGVNQKVF